MHFEIMVTGHRDLESDSAQGLSPGGGEGVKRETVGSRGGLMVQCPIKKVLQKKKKSVADSSRSRLELW